MKLVKTWRWFGPQDPVKLNDLMQMGVEAVVTSLLHIPVGEEWTPTEIEKRKRLIEHFPFHWTIVESLNIHESIKTGSKERDYYIEQYIKSIRNLSAAGIRTVCYNFMPVLDWVRTHYAYPLINETETIRFDFPSLAAFDCFILKRKDAEQSYPERLVKTAKYLFNNLSSIQKKELQNTCMGALPGTDQVLSLDEFRAGLQRFNKIGAERMRENLAYFLRKVIPVAEDAGVKLAIHPDDPPFSVFGLPRIVSTAQDLQLIHSMIPSASNGITFCTGSLGVREDNDVPDMLEQFGNRIHFFHFRNVIIEADGSFMEADHLDGKVDMAAVMKKALRELTRRKEQGDLSREIPWRPDHGFRMLDDFRRDTYPGYALNGRFKGMMQIEGLEKGVRRFLWPDILN